MPVITINGPVGSGAVEVGQMVAQMLNINYVDRLVFAQAAKLVRSPVGALIDKEQRVDGFRQRLTRLLVTMLERDSLYWDDDPYHFGPCLEMLPAGTYTELARDPASTLKRVNDKTFIEAITAVIKDLCWSGNVVIIGRGANMILADVPNVIHVGMLAPQEVRVETIIQREHFSRAEAQVYVDDLEEARVKFFRKYFKTNPNDPALYHMMLNMGEMQLPTAAEILAHTARDLAFREEGS